MAPAPACKLKPSATTDCCSKTITKDSTAHAKVPCSYDWCQHKFNTEKEHQRHKKHDPEHFYCKKCNIDCKDWQDLINHKIIAMTPYLEAQGKEKLSVGEMPAHIVCEFCGEDFKSFGGRKRHRSQMHPADQEIKCPGCTSIFPRAFFLVEHLERGRCEGISRREFFLKMQQKFIISQVMVAPDKITKALGSHNTMIAKPGQIASPSEADEEDECGVSLLDQPNTDIEGHQALIPVPQHHLLAHMSAENWPDLPSKALSLQTANAASHLDESFRRLSINDATGYKVSTIAANGGADTHQQFSKAIPNSMPQSAWTGIHSKAHHSNEKAAPEPRKWTLVRQQIEEEVQISEQTNLLRTHWWDPFSSDYKVDLFYNVLVQRYCCPFPDCIDDNVMYLAVSDLEDHVAMTHLKRIFDCPVCFKRFSCCAALIGHAESTWKCGIRDSTNFKKLIEDISGGYLKAKCIAEPKIYCPETALVKHGQPGGGVTSTLYFGARPNE